MSGRYFAGLSAVGAATIYSAGEPCTLGLGPSARAQLLSSLTLTPVHGLNHFKPSVLDAPTCLEQPWVQTYPIADGLNNLLCKLNTLFVSAGVSSGGKEFLSYFGGVFVAAVLVTVYEGFRPSSRRSASKDAHGNVEGFGMRLGVAQLSTVALLVGQVITAGIALPIYYACVSWSTPRHWRRHQHKVDLGDEVFFLPESAKRKVRATFKHSVQYNANVPRSSFLYTTLVSTLVGFIVPSLVMQHAPAEYAYAAQSVWQIFPLYMLAINVVLPPLLRKSFTAVTPVKGIVLIAALGIAASLKEQWGLYDNVVNRGADLKDIFSLTGPDGTLGFQCHRVLAVDFVMTTIAVGSKVLLALARRQRAGVAGKVAYGAVLLAGALAIGPGGSIMAMWAYGELVALRHSREYAEVKEAKLVAGKQAAAVADANL